MNDDQTYMITDNTFTLNDDSDSSDEELGIVEERKEISQMRYQEIELNSIMVEKSSFVM